MANVDIAKFMRTAGLPITNEIVTLREQGIDQYLKQKISEEEIIALVRLYYTGNCNEDIFNEFVSIFKEIDNTFSDDLVIEIRLLAGLILCEVVKQNKWKDLIAVLEVYAQTFEFMGCESICKNVTDELADDFEERRIRIREEITLNKNKIKLLSKNMNLKGTSEEQEEIVYNEDVVDNIVSILNKVNELVNQVNIANQLQNESIKILREESQILWWLLTGYSDDMKMKYSEIDPKIAAVIIGKDLAGCVLTFPGPFPVKSLLIKALDFVRTSEETYSFFEYIDAIEDNIIDELICDVSVDTPILFALKKKEENGKENWTNSFYKKFSCREEGYSVIDMAYETYLECMLLHDRNE